MTLDELRDLDQRAVQKYVDRSGIALDCRARETLACRIKHYVCGWFAAFDGVRLVVVFDGKSPRAKEATLMARRR